jgi:hypothetical protein
MSEPLMQLTRYELSGHAEFLTDSSFKQQSCPFKGDIPWASTNYRAGQGKRISSC